MTGANLQNVAALWAQTVEALRAKIEEQNFVTWIEPIVFESITEAGVLALVVPTNFFRGWIKDNYLAVIIETLSGVAGKPVTVSLKVAEAASEDSPKESKPATKRKIEKSAATAVDDSPRARNARVQAMQDKGGTLIPRAMMDKLIELQLSGHEYRLLLFILRQTLGWRRAQDRIANSQIDELIGWDRRNSHRTIKYLQSRNMIRAKGFTKAGRLYEVELDATKWTERLHVVKKDNKHPSSNLTTPEGIVVKKDDATPESVINNDDKGGESVVNKAPTKKEEKKRILKKGAGALGLTLTVLSDSENSESQSGESFVTILVALKENPERLALRSAMIDSGLYLGGEITRIFKGRTLDEIAAYHETRLHLHQLQGTKPAFKLKGIDLAVLRNGSTILPESEESAS